MNTVPSILVSLSVVSGLSALSVACDDPEGTWNPADCGACGDYNQDGSYDGADLEMFFRDWQDGLTDQTCDGVCDERDIPAFLEAWESAECHRTRQVGCIEC